MSTKEKQRSENIVRMFPNEFTLTPNDKLMCVLCQKIVNVKKNFFVESHRETKKHKDSLYKMDFLNTRHL